MPIRATSVTSINPAAAAIHCLPILILWSTAGTCIICKHHHTYGVVGYKQYDVLYISLQGAPQKTIPYEKYFWNVSDFSPTRRIQPIYPAIFIKTTNVVQ